MSVELQETLSVVAFILAGVFFLASIVLFFVLRIPNVIGYLTGSNKQKAIDRIKVRNSSLNEASSGDLSSSASGNLSKTQKIGTMRLDDASTTVLNNVGDTTVLSESGETTVLSGADDAMLTDRQFYRSQNFVDNEISDRAFVFVKEYEIHFTDSKELIE